MDNLSEVVDELVSLSDQKKAEDIRVFHVAEKNWMTEYVVVMGAKNSIHGKAIVESLMDYFSEIAKKYSRDFYDPIRVSGSADSGWVILDINSIVVHCMNQEKRAFYELDQVFEKQGTIYHY